jgi:hypothetical protein
MPVDDRAVEDRLFSGPVTADRRPADPSPVGPQASVGAGVMANSSAPTGPTRQQQ